MSLLDLIDAVTPRYNRPGRRHHTTRHIEEILDEMERLVGLVPFPLPFEIVPVVEAAWLHDAEDSEEASAALASSLAVHPEEAARLVMVTKEHRPDPFDPAGALLSDADMWIVSTSEGRYDRYVRDVRAEYPQYNDREWALGRSKWAWRTLKQARDTGLFFFGPEADREARNERAKFNLGREVIGYFDQGRPITSHELVDFNLFEFTPDIVSQLE